MIEINLIKGFSTYVAMAGTIIIEKGYEVFFYNNIEQNKKYN